MARRRNFIKKKWFLPRKIGFRHNPVTIVTYITDNMLIYGILLTIKERLCCINTSLTEINAIKRRISVYFTFVAYMLIVTS